MRSSDRVIRKPFSRRGRARTVHPPGLFQRLVERLRGREQLLVRPGEGLPLLLLTYPRGGEETAREIESVFARILPRLPRRILGRYDRAFAALPAMVVVILRPVNACGCLGHLHPAGAESRLARRLAGELGGRVGEIDLAYDSIRRWEPHPISSLAAGEMGGRRARLHFQAALLAVLLHELEHVAFPDRAERDIRDSSNELYLSLMEEWVREAGGSGYGISGEGKRETGDGSRESG